MLGFVIKSNLPALVYCTFWLLFLTSQLARASIQYTWAVVPYNVQIAIAFIVCIYVRTATSYQVQLATASTLYIRPVIPYQVQLYTASILYIISLKLGYVIAVAVSTSSARWF